jgi:beta-lactamase regulating signal transducer with metallopeptidase domain
MTLLAILLKGSILMAAAAMAAALMGRASAASRHFIWTLTIAGLLVLPVLSMAMPAWEVAVRVAPVDTPAAISSIQRIGTTHVAPARLVSAGESRVSPDASSARSSAPLPWLALLVRIYAFVGLLLLVRVAVQQSIARRIVRESVAVTHDEWTSLLDECAARIGVRRRVALLRSPVQLMPITTGTVSSSIVVPAGADDWDDDRRRAVLLHELAHIVRCDCLTQWLSAIAGAVYWFHPGMWYVARRLRIERELACDDRVLAAGAQARDYAGHLLDLAYSWSGRRVPALVVGMASFGKLEGRMRAVLDPGRNRTAPTRRMWLAGAAVGIALLLPLAALTMTTASADVRSSLMGPSSNAHEALPQERSASADPAQQPIGSPDTVAGTWQIRPSRSRDRVELSIRAGRFADNGEMPLSELESFISQPLADINGPVRFTISRDAGSLEIEGTLNSGSGSGTFRFVPSETFIAGLVRRGFRRPSARQLFALAQNDIGFEFVDELASQQYERPDVDTLVRASHHGVGTDFVREMGQAGYRVGTLDALIRLRDHGVDADYVRGMRVYGVSGVPADDLVRARDHGVDPEYVADLKALGYDALPLDGLIRARDHGVDGEYLRGMRQLGHTFTLEDAIRARDHGVDPEFAGGMRRLGYTLAADELIRARDHGVDPVYVEFMAAEGYKGLPIETMIRLRDHGVTPDYVREVRKSGRDKLSPDEIIRLRDRGDSVYERKLGQWNYHVERLMARLRESETGRGIEQALLRLMR